jgi:urea carboxylase-associated protein 2
MPDTLKNQHTFLLTKGHVLLSDMGRVFASIIRDDLGWHDTVAGTCNADLVEKRWGKKTYQEAHNHYHRNGFNSFLNELAKYGLGKKDLTANLNWFSKVKTDDDGNMAFSEGHSHAGATVDLRFEMDTIVVLHTCPHPMNPASEYPSHPLRYQLFKAAPVTDADPCKTSSPEATRAFANNALYHLFQ